MLSALFSGLIQNRTLHTVAHRVYNTLHLRIVEFLLPAGWRDRSFKISNLVGLLEDLLSTAKRVARFLSQQCGPYTM